METVEHTFDWDELLLCIADKRVIPIVGKEMLMVSVDGKEMLLERYLAGRLAVALGVPADHLPADPDLNEVALLYLRQGGDSRKIYSRIKVLMDERELPVPQCLKKLAAITDFNLFVSITFDSLLRLAINQERFGGENKTQCLVYSTNREVKDLSAELKELAGACVYHLFGQVSAAIDYAVTEEDFLEFVHALQSETRRPQVLFDEFRNNNLLFLGCGFPNWLERFLIRTVINERLRDVRGTYEFVADKAACEDKNLTFFLQQYKAEVFPSGDPVEFVDELYERWSAQQPTNPQEVPPSPTEGKMEPGSIFLSYASEDRDAVRNMKETLEQVGVEVWFDERALIPGDSWDREIRTNIRRCAVFLPFISRQAQQRLEGYFRREWKWASERDEGMDESLRFIQPIVLDETPDNAEGVPDYFWTKHCSRFPGGQPTDDFVEQLKRLQRNRRQHEAS